ncbi:ATP-binding protein [Variovorax ginsengisoli]|uniref:AAA family ATPase n=1 Tax=Variovorax ginsengisoli TaxID=363844 RepID=A0ABT8SCE7_9BURK|nr:ATP-binding protein [Variovorax ginsengisoli]MDN8617295.1 AAA family ATPase [Variovorax ginsengisoli]MDO1536465.1 AAA family ATPase [Variovorax ginsengisoli]
MSLRITSIDFQHYKALKRFSIELERVNLLTGANNAGKSTVIGALRALAVALRTARARSADRVTVGGTRRLGYRINQRLLPISVENVATNYEDGESTVTFHLSNESELALYFDREEGCVLVADGPGSAVTTASAFRSRFPLELNVVPVLGAVEHKEMLLEEDTVNAALATPRASRHFRNYWYRRQDEFTKFADLVAATWPGMVIKPPELDFMSKELSMFVSEDRVDREIHWVGFGFQIWCQLLTHLTRAAPGSLVVVDEPEIYLHPDIQRKLLHVMKGLDAEIVLATHSAEILAEADPADVVIIDKNRRRAERLSDIGGVQRAVKVLGSQQNLVLASLARNRRLLFTQNPHDFLLLRRFARRLGYGELAAGTGLTSMSAGSLDRWERVRDMAEGVGVAAGSDLVVAAIWSREARPDAEIETILTAMRPSVGIAHVLRRWDLQAYLLVPSAWDRALQLELNKQRKAKPLGLDMEAILMEVTEDMREMVAEERATHRTRWLLESFGQAPDPRAPLETAPTSDDSFETSWRSPSERPALLPGARTMRRLNERILQLAGVTLSEARIVESMQPEEIAPDLCALLVELDKFRQIDV